MILKEFGSWWSWGAAHEKSIKDLKAFYENHKDTPKHHGKRENEKTLASWISHRRCAKKTDKLSLELEGMILKEFGSWWSWDAPGAAQEKSIKDLKAFYEQHKDTPKYSGKRENEKTLAKWIGLRRREKKTDKLSLELEGMIRKEFGSWWYWDAQEKSIKEDGLFFVTQG